MSAQRKPGDVARVNGSVAVRTDDNMSWWTTSGRLSDCNVAHVHPLVVIDPEDREQVERLEADFAERCGWSNLSRSQRADSLQAALREFANPTPPKPDEPMGLGAVVEDEEGMRWSLLPPTVARGWACWDEPKFDRDYADIDVVRVLSEGVTE